METIVFLIGTALMIGVTVLNFVYKETRYFNANRFKNSVEDKIVPIEFRVIKVEEGFTQIENEHPIHKPLWKYTVETCFFLRKGKNFINEKYVFWDDPEKYKVGDILTLDTIKQ
jgi:hypothetical protein